MVHGFPTILIDSVFEDDLLTPIYEPFYDDLMLDFGDEFIDPNKSNKLA